MHHFITLVIYTTSINQSSFHHPLLSIIQPTHVAGPPSPSSLPSSARHPSVTLSFALLYALSVPLSPFASHNYMISSLPVSSSRISCSELCKPTRSTHMSSWCLKYAEEEQIESFCRHFIYMIQQSLSSPAFVPMIPISANV